MRDLFFNHILRNLAKYTYKFIYPKTLKHNRRYWPFYKVLRNSSGQIEKVYFRNQLIADHCIDFKINHRKCMLVATGPSVQEVPADWLSRQDIDYIGVNGAIELSSIQFKYYVIIDHDFTKQRFDLIEKILNTDCYFFITARCLNIILKRKSFDQIQCKFKIIEIISTGKNEQFMGEPVWIDSTHPHYYFHQDFGFSSNLFDPIFDYHTVAYTALQIMAALKYEHLYMLGVDMNQLHQPRFYENHDSKQPTLLDQHLPTILKAFNTAAVFLNDQNISAYNLSKHSKIEAFPKVELDSIDLV